MTTSDVPVPGGAQRVPTYAFSEDAKTKDLERVALNESDGSDLALGAKLGALTETAPATDTGSSGLNGRLQRVAQRLTTLIGAVGAPVFGAGTAAAAQRVTLASDDPGVAVFGDAGGAKIVTDANGTIQQYLRGLVSQWISGTLTLASRAASAAVTLTRTADTNAYAAGDIVGTATGSTAALQFANMGPSGAVVQIVSAELEIDAAAAIAGETSYRGYLYNVTPPSALGDNAAFDLASGDRNAYLGFVDFGTPVDLGSTLYVRATPDNCFVRLSGTDIFMYLVTMGAYTPASARVYRPKLFAVA
jgi:hypothetical protein